MYETGTWGAESILFNLRDIASEGAITQQETKKISDAIRQFTITITYDGIILRMEIT